MPDNQPDVPPRAEYSVAAKTKDRMESSRDLIEQLASRPLPECCERMVAAYRDDGIQCLYFYDWFRDVLWPADSVLGASTALKCLREGKVGTPGHRVLAIWASQIPMPGSLAVIEELCRCDPPRGRGEYLLEALARFERPEDLRLILKSLQRRGKPHIDRRVSAAWACGRLGSAEAIPALVRSLVDPDHPDVVMYAALSLHSLAWEPLFDELVRLVDRPEVKYLYGGPAEPLACIFGERAVPFLTSVALDPDYYGRAKRGIQGLAFTNCLAGRFALVTLLRASEDHIKRVCIIDSLRQAGEPDVADELVGLAERPEFRDVSEELLGCAVGIYVKRKLTRPAEIGRIWKSLNLGNSGYGPNGAYGGSRWFKFVEHFDRFWVDGPSALSPLVGAQLSPAKTLDLGRGQHKAPKSGE